MNELMSVVSTGTRSTPAIVPPAAFRISLYVDNTSSPKAKFAIRKYHFLPTARSSGAIARA
jgi:hypothetical protein